MRRLKRNLNLSCETRSEPFFRRVLQICTYALLTEKSLKILFLHVLYRLYFAMRETSPALGNATARVTLRKVEPPVAAIHASNRCDPARILLHFSLRGIQRDRRAGRQKAGMIDRVASDVLARSRCDKSCAIDRSERENQSFASGPSIARHSISSLKSSADNHG